MRNSILIVLASAVWSTGCVEKVSVPSYLADYNDAYLENPRKANLDWFQEAGYGMFIHYGLYSLLEKGEWVQLRDTIPVATMRN